MKKILVGFVLLGLTGCSLISPQSWRNTKIIESSAGELALKLASDKSAYQPGEAMLLKISVTNTTKKPILIRKLNIQTLGFWPGRNTEDRRVQRYPVVSRLEEKALKEQGVEVAKLDPGQSLTRSFLHTRMTEDTGQFVAQAQMEPYAGTDSIRTGKLYSNVVDYQVGGKPLFLRDSKGLMFLDDAVKLASERIPGAVVLSDGLLIEDNMGFYKWWINLDYRSAEGKQVKVGYLIDPYFGSVWSQAKPFKESMKPDRAVAGNTGFRLLGSAGANTQAVASKPPATDFQGGAKR